MIASDRFTLVDELADQYAEATGMLDASSTEVAACLIADLLLAANEAGLDEDDILRQAIKCRQQRQ
jgi:hypothetical protein